MEKKGPLCVLACYVLWGLMPAFWKLLADVDSLYILAARVVWAMVLTGGALLWRRDRLEGVRRALRDRGERLLLAAAGCTIAVNWGVYIWAAGHGHMLDASLAYYMNPILAILLGTAVFREKLTVLQWLAAAVLLTGADGLYAYWQDRVIFPRSIENYAAYQNQTPFLLPTRDSIRRCLGRK